MKKINIWKNNIDNFIALTSKNRVRMMLVGGLAVGFHGYKRYSSDIDFWIETSDSNFDKLIKVFNEMGYGIKEFPPKVRNKKQNISIKFSPFDLDLELITHFSSVISFKEAYKRSETTELFGSKNLKYHVLSYDDLISSKIKSGRPKDLLDVQMLQKIKLKNKKRLRR